MRKRADEVCVSAAAASAASSEDTECTLKLAGEPVEIATEPPYDYPQDPSMVVVDPGQAGPDERPALIVVRASVNNGSATKVMRVRIGPWWPCDVFLADEAEHMSLEGWWTHMARSRHRADEIALAGLDLNHVPAFRTLDVGAWTAGPGVEFASDEYCCVSDLIPVGVPATSGLDGTTYGVVYRIEDTWEHWEPPVMAVLDSAGYLLLGPLDHGPLHDYVYYWTPTPTPAMAWSGASYLLASAHAECNPENALCVRHSVVITRVRGDDSEPSVEVASVIPSVWLDGWLGQPDIVEHQGTMWVAWDERQSYDAEESTIRLARLGETGVPNDEPLVLATGVRLLGPVKMTSTPLGVILTWVEPLSGESSDDPQGGLIIVHRLGGNGELDTPVTIVTRPVIGRDAVVSVASIAYPRSVLVTWSAEARNDAFRPSILLSRLDCVAR